MKEKRKNHRELGPSLVVRHSILQDTFRVKSNCHRKNSVFRLLISFLSFLRLKIECHLAAIGNSSIAPCKRDANLKYETLIKLVIIADSQLLGCTDITFARMLFLRYNPSQKNIAVVCSMFLSVLLLLPK